MSDIGKLESSLESGINYLKASQQKDGSFLSCSSPSKNFNKLIKFHSVFSTALISQLLSKNLKSESEDILKNTSSFLLSQRSKNWSWNYWVRKSKEYKDMPYPDDLDDTFCCLSAIFLYNSKLVTGEVLANATNLLTTLETREGGPYRTWLVDNRAKEIWQDVDLGVNANIAYFLESQDVTLPNLTDLFDNAIENNQFTTPYYPTPYPIIYFISRFTKEKNRTNKLTKIILKLNPKNPLDTALKVSSLINLSYPVTKFGDLVTNITATQNKNGSWNASPFYTGVNPKKDKKFYAGSGELTTAFCLEAISLYLKSLQTENNSADPEYIEVNDLVIAKVEKRFENLGPNLKNEARIYLKQVLKNNKDKQITLLPLFFANSLDQNKNSVDKELIINLGAASVYGWLAYTIYDNFLDVENKTSSLPLANVCLRELTKIFNSSLPEETGFPSIFQEVMDKLEEANTWEVTHCRSKKVPYYRNYEQLANKSLGHALGCVAVLMSLGYKKTSPEVKSLLSFFKHFLIARQLNDDAHDWETDLKGGHINSVGAILLSQKRGKLQELFWTEIIDEVCELILQHCKKARIYLSKVVNIENPSLLLRFVERQEKSVEFAKTEKAKTLAFLKSYSIKH